MKYVHGWAFPDADSFMSNELKADGTYQATHLAAALEHVTNWTVALDAGAHVGTWSRTLSQKFETVIAIEPSEDTHEALVANLAAFGCSNVETRRIALGDKPGKVTMHLEGRGLELQNTGARFVQPGGVIPVETIDSWKLPSLGFVKMDIEGSEVFALRGAVETLKRCKPIVLYEDKGFWKRYGERRDAAAKVLQSIGYREITRIRCDLIWGPK
jgi:FkbM family methyltransferase